MDLGLLMDRNQPRPIREAFMIVRAWGHLTSMSLHQWIVLCVMGLVPVLLFPILPLCKTVGPFDLPIKPTFPISTLQGVP